MSPAIINQATSAGTSELILHRARLVGGNPVSEPVDVTIRNGTVESLGPAGTTQGDRVVDLDGRVLIPGLWDHHVHFTEWVLSRSRVDLAPYRSAAAVAESVRVALVNRAVGATPRPLIGYGYRDALWPDRPHRDLLDTVAPDVPVCLVGGDLHGCWLNTRALEVLGLVDRHPSGVLREADCIPAWNYAKAQAGVGPAGTSGSGSDNHGGTDESVDRAALAVADAAAQRGVVGIVEFERAPNVEVWQRRFTAGHRSLRVQCGIWADDLDAAVAAGHRTGDAVSGTDGLITVGPVKIVIDGSLNTRTAYCYQSYPGAEGDHPQGLLNVAVNELTKVLSRATAHGLSCAVHAIGDRANAIALDAFAATGARGSIEHAQLLRPADIARFAELGVVAGIQPRHTIDDRDVADQHWPGRTDRTFAFADMVDAGVQLAMGSDAPVAPLDPWVSIASAVRRTDDDRPAWHPEQRISVSDALFGSLPCGLRPAPGDDADLAVLEIDPLHCSESELADMPVWGTMLGGRWTWRAEG